MFLFFANRPALAVANPPDEQDRRDQKREAEGICQKFSRAHPSRSVGQEPDISKAFAPVGPVRANIFQSLGRLVRGHIPG